jgi:hypothetical protein
MGPQRAGGGHRHGPAQVQYLPHACPTQKANPKTGV